MLFINLNCNAQSRESSRLRTPFLIGVTPGLQEFEILTAAEKKQRESMYELSVEMDSMISPKGISDSLELYSLFVKNRMRGLAENRSRWFVGVYKNGKEKEGADSVSLPCDCYVDEDTILVSAGIGFVEVGIKIVKDSFESCYLEAPWTDELIYKATISDTTLQDHILVDSKAQKMILREKPVYKIGEKLTGGLFIHTNNYYTVGTYPDIKKFDTNYVMGKIYFTCKTRKKSTWDIPWMDLKISK